MSLASCSVCGAKKVWREFPQSMRVTVCTKNATHGLGDRFIDYIDKGEWNSYDKRIYYTSRPGRNRPSKITNEFTPDW